MQYSKEQQISLYYNVVTTFRCVFVEINFSKKGKKRKKKILFSHFSPVEGEGKSIYTYKNICKIT